MIPEFRQLNLLKTKINIYLNSKKPGIIMPGFLILLNLR